MEFTIHPNLNTLKESLLTMTDTVDELSWRNRYVRRQLEPTLAWKTINVFRIEYSCLLSNARWFNFEHCFTNNFVLSARRCPFVALIKINHNAFILPENMKLKPLRRNNTLRDCREHGRMEFCRTFFESQLEWCNQLHYTRGSKV